MLQQERIEDDQEALRLALIGWQAEMWTSLPGILQTFDATKQTCVVQPAIKGIFRKKDGTTETVQLPQCLDVPVQFAGGGGVTLTFPLTEGDEGLIVFSSRCIDAWWQSGGVQVQAEIRMHDLSDGFFIPGVRSLPRKLSPAISTDSTQLRADDGTYYVELKAALLTLKHPTKVTIDSPIASFTGQIQAAGEVTAKYSGSSVTLSGHKHKQGNDSHGDTEVDTDAPTAGT